LLWAVTNGNWLDGPLLPHKPLTKGPFFPPDRFYRTVFSGPFLPGPFLPGPFLPGPFLPAPEYGCE